eukprot:1455267-Rhodomonas_salina.2
MCIRDSNWGGAGVEGVAARPAAGASALRSCYAMSEYYGILLRDARYAARQCAVLLLLDTVDIVEAGTD